MTSTLARRIARLQARQPNGVRTMSDDALNARIADLSARLAADPGIPAELRTLAARRAADPMAGDQLGRLITLLREHINGHGHKDQSP